MIFLQVLQMIVQMVLIGVFVYWLAITLDESRQKDLRIDRLMSELHAQKYRTEKILDANSDAMMRTVDLVGEVLKSKVEPHYEPTNE